MDARTFLTAAIVLCGATTLAHAQQSIGTFKSWTAWASNEADGKTCFISAQPTNSKASQPIKSRDPAYFYITTKPSAKIANEASTIIGYAFKDGSKVTVSIDQAQFLMFTDKDTAWIDNPGQEAQLVAAMKSGKAMIVEGTSRRGTVTTDTYSLSGVSAALDAMAKACPSTAATQ